MAQDGDARYLAFEVLSGTISPAADVFSLGLAALELVSDYDMPINGDLWTSIRQLELPAEILSALNDEHLKQLLLQMIHLDHKQRPTAKEILESETIQNEVTRRRDIRSVDRSIVSLGPSCRLAIRFSRTGWSFTPQRFETKLLLFFVVDLAESIAQRESLAHESRMSYAGQKSQTTAELRRISRRTIRRFVLLVRRCFIGQRFFFVRR